MIRRLLVALGRCPYCGRRLPKQAADECADDVCDFRLGVARLDAA